MLPSNLEGVIKQRCNHQQPRDTHRRPHCLARTGNRHALHGPLGNQMHFRDLQPASTEREGRLRAHQPRHRRHGGGQE